MKVSLDVRTQRQQIMGIDWLKKISSRGILVIIFSLLMLAFSLICKPFFTFSNLTNILLQNSIIGCIALGQMLVILTSGIDLSVGSFVAVSSVLVAMFQSYGLLSSISIALAACAFLGLCNGILVSKIDMPPFVATLGMMGVARGIALMLSGGFTVTGTTVEFRAIAYGNIGSIPIAVFVFVALALIVFVVLRYTHWGVTIFALGGNEATARLSGINVTGTKLFVYSVCGLFAGVAGIIYTARVTVGQPIAGYGYELTSIAAVVIGGTDIFGGKGDVYGTILGVLILGIVANFMNLVGISPFIHEAVKGAMILGAVYFSVTRRN